MIKTKDALLFEKAANFIKLYDGESPLSDSLRYHFKLHKNMGITDRRRFSQIVFSYFRAGRLIKTDDLEDCLMLSVFLMGTDEISLIKGISSKFSFIKPELFKLTIPEKIKLLNSKGINTDADMAFPYPEVLSKEVEVDSYRWSMFRQPYVFIRIRKKYLNEVAAELEAGEYKPLSVEADGTCQAFEPGAKLTILPAYEKGMYVIQDKNSQQTLDLLPDIKSSEYWWDCCCGSGGKSLLFKERFPNNRIYLSDSRKSIIDNAHDRMKAAGYDRPEIGVIDLISGKIPDNFKNKFDGIIADVPCTGSGTWARTPEQVHFFRPIAITDFTEKQRKIIDQIDPCLKKGGHLLYITCSVFKDENESIVEHIKKKGYSLTQKKYLFGWKHNCDSFFAALLVKK